ncbi:uncharacterized protein LOC127283813 [Leptopilina boulardi]|uniref:uncharacterized protein LOC127283813 n=1 Tax=Leptopilina boulardi TaxID=63433 RepID=UPI0021F677D4|nr:uncharacterized protein LOC127283813 [Leptopilina boulardi]
MIARLIQWIFENLNDWNNQHHFKNYTLYVEAYYPFVWNYSPVFEVTCIIEYFGTFLATVAYTGTDGFFSQIVLHLSGEYHILRLQLLRLSFAFAQTAYDCEWYHLPPQKVKGLLLLMQSGHKPVAITAGKFCVLNLILFGSIMKTSMGYLSCLITMRQTSKY